MAGNIYELRHPRLEQCAGFDDPRGFTTRQGPRRWPATFGNRFAGAAPLHTAPTGFSAFVNTLRGDFDGIFSFQARSSLFPSRLSGRASSEVCFARRPTNPDRFLFRGRSGLRRRAGAFTSTATFLCLFLEYSSRYRCRYTRARRTRFWVFRLRPRVCLKYLATLNGPISAPVENV